jgi:hypothetical protein
VLDERQMLHPKIIPLAQAGHGLTKSRVQTSFG